jgi:integrase
MGRKKPLNTLYVRSKEAADAKRTWDTKLPGLVLRVQGEARSYYLYYRFNKQPRWLKIGNALQITDKDARDLARKMQVQIANGIDPGAERRAGRGGNTFGDLARNYVELYAKKYNKSWEQPDTLIRRHLLPRWDKLPAKSITKADVRNAFERIGAPIAANQTLAAVRKIFSWAEGRELIPFNPARGIKQNPKNDRERFLSDVELPLVWPVLSTLLRVVLLTGQRGGETVHMRWQDLADGWWIMPGSPMGDWPGTKNGRTHRVWLPQPVQNIINELNRGQLTGFVFGPPRELHGAMRRVCKTLGIEDKVTAHDLRRTFLTNVTRSGFEEKLMEVIANHRTKSTAAIYNRYHYSPEIQHVMETVAANLLALAEGKAEASNVVPIKLGL